MHLYHSILPAIVPSSYRSYNGVFHCLNKCDTYVIGSSPYIEVALSAALQLTIYTKLEGLYDDGIEE